jgi:hypothetical protein
MRVALALGLFVLAITAHAGTPPPVGGVLDKTTAAAAEGLLPPETLARYAAGEFTNTIAAWPPGPPWEPAFDAACKQNADRFDVDQHGTIVEKASGKPATGIYGLPFRIDANDPKAGVKVMWNAYYALWRVASSHDVLGIAWVGRTAKQRDAILESHLLFYEGAPSARAPKENALDLAQQARAVVTSPADLNGTASLSWRFRDPGKQDQSWTYVPALRRVRQVSPANRSDGFLGSDLSQDDGAIFDGKPEAFEWKLVGSRKALVLADPGSLTGKTKRAARPDGGFDDDWPLDTKVVGFQDPAWKGLAWAPVAPVLVERTLWVVEAKPRDPYYLFARIELGIDQETFQGTTSRKFDQQGALLRSLQFLLGAPEPIEVGGEKLRIPGSSMGYILAENLKQDRATIAGMAPPGVSVHSRRVLIDPALFQLDRLGAGK